MYDVAQKAGVSLMTVSRVINNKGDVSSETRQRVLNVIRDLGYRPSGIARSLAAGQTFTIGLVVPDIANPYFSGMAHGVAMLAYEEGFGVLLCDSEELPERELALLDVLEEKRVDGVVVAAPRSPNEKLLPILKRHSNVVIVNRLFDDYEVPGHLGFVINDDRNGGHLITSYLLTAAIGRLDSWQAPPLHMAQNAATSAIAKHWKVPALPTILITSPTARQPLKGGAMPPSILSGEIQKSAGCFVLTIWWPLVRCSAATNSSAGCRKTWRSSGMTIFPWLHG